MSDSVDQGRKKLKTKKCLVDGCCFMAETNYHVKYHMITQHGIGTKIKCPYCDYTCANNSMLNSHLKSHSNERPYVCDTCGMSYKFSTILRKHLMKFPDHTSTSLVKKSPKKEAEKKSRKEKLNVNISTVVHVKVELSPEEPQSNADLPIKIEPTAAGVVEQVSNESMAYPNEEHSYAMEGPLDLSMKRNEEELVAFEDVTNRRRSRKCIPTWLDPSEMYEDNNYQAQYNK